MLFRGPNNKGHSVYSAGQLIQNRLNDMGPPPPPPPVNTVLPAITGTPTVGQTLTCSTGTWTGNPITFEFQWFRPNGEVIPGATGPTYVLDQADTGLYVYCGVTAFNDGGSRIAYAPATTWISGRPVMIAPPLVSGYGIVGATLQVSDGTWAAFPAPTFTYEWWWQVHGAIPGANLKTYLLSPIDAGRQLFARVRATNTFGLGTGGWSDGVTIPILQNPTNIAPPVITGVPTVGQVQTCTTGTWQGFPEMTFNFQWRAGGVDIPGATEPTYTLTAAELGKTYSCSVTGTNVLMTSARVFSNGLGPVT